MKRRICTICVRGGSKGVPNKNMRLMNGKPLIVHSIEQAKSSQYFDAIAVSSDSQQLLDIAEKNGVNYLIQRPAELATDTAPKIPVIRQCLLAAEKRSGNQYDTICDLDATSPLRSILDIRNAVDLLESREISNVITGTPARRSPYFNLIEQTDNGCIELSKRLEKPVIRRQDAPKCWDMNASIYVWQRGVLISSDYLFHTDTQLYEMPEERSFDIDSELDFRIVEFIMRELRSTDSMK